ncbi:MAG: uroporphyrinogen decarboxylase [Vicinamibacterales bacterium]
MPDPSAGTVAESGPSVPQPRFLRACLGLPVDRTPIWIMRQAGRYLPEYRAVRRRHDFLTCCRTPELACEITLQPVRRLGVDAAILFSDILVPLPGMGVEVSFDPGPRIEGAVRSPGDVARLRVADPEEATGYLLDAIRLLRKALPPDVPLIGFAGAPFTLASYLVEGSGSKSFSQVKRLLFGDPPVAHRLLATCAETVVKHAVAQVRAGAQALMLFDTWAGLLAPADYAAFALPYARQVFDAVRCAADEVHQQVPKIYYAGDGAGYLEQCRGIAADVVGIDWRIDLDVARRRLGPTIALQGNLDPAVLLAPPPVIRDRTRRVLEAAHRAEGERAGSGPASGHVFNLGHGILPATPAEHARVLVDAVHELSME